MTTLDNGLVVIVREDHSAPVVAVQAWCQSGSIHEDRWLGAGLSHVLEHMLFKGTTTRPGSQIDLEVQAAGGMMNAYTSFDRTVYHIDVPNTGFATAVEVLCDIMQHATLPEEELAKEKQVILREMDMNQDDPSRRSSRRLFETAFTLSPYRLTVIGYPDIFNQVQREDILAYYRERYAPNNLFVVIAGDVKTAEAVSRVQAAFAQAKARPLPARSLPAEPRQTGHREILEEAAIELGHIHLSWHIPEIRHTDIPALDVLATLLGGGRSSRLFREIREKQGLVHSIDAWTYNPGDPGLFGVSAVLDGAQLPAAREAILAEIERVKLSPVTGAELAKVIKQFVAGTLATRKTMSGQAHDLGANWMAAHDLNFSERYLASVKHLTPGDIQRVALKYLHVTNRTLYALLPTGSVPPSTLVVESNTDHPIQRFTLANGLRLLVKEDHRLPFVEMSAVLHGGILSETPANNGVTQLMARMLLQGTATRSAEQIAVEIESLGGHIDSWGGNNSFGVSLEVLHDDLGTGLTMLEDVLRHPLFPENEFENEQQIQLAGLKAQKDHVLQSASLLLRRTLFGPAGYGLNQLGTESSVAALQTADLRACHQRWTRPDNCVLAVYGDVKTDEVLAATEKLFGGWLQPAETLPRPDQWPPTTFAPGTRRVAETVDKKQAVILIGLPGLTLYDPDRFALDLIQEACSDLGSRLFARIRDKLGLAYFVGVQSFLGLTPGSFMFYAGTAPEQAAQVESELLAEMELLRSKGLEPEELQRAKAKVIGQKKIGRQDLRGYALTTALDELYGLGYANTDQENARYEAVTEADIQAVAARSLHREGLVIAQVGPAA